MLGPRFHGRQVLGLSLELKRRARRQVRSNLNRFLPPLEAMKRRSLFATWVWAISTGGDWDVAGNGVNQANPAEHHIQTASDDAVIPAPGSGNSMTRTGGTEFDRSPTSRSNLDLSGVILLLGAGTVTLLSHLNCFPSS
jgi:hypothetical protein